MKTDFSPYWGISEKPIETKKPIDTPDYLRGFALLGIAGRLFHLFGSIITFSLVRWSGFGNGQKADRYIPQYKKLGDISAFL
ncbi:hypothetical protein [Brevibacillus massiliensis]|jgi:uncharacterized membrane protein YeiB|uniref:hypothetical protein n=1 Tax=Brevibacillus massiliensis TaxID=1118054 RepID=UPI0003020798|nr:hypothetical protein [Brevibacillus massiliensis]